MTTASDPTRFEMRQNERLPFIWDVSAYLEEGQTPTLVSITMQRIDPYPTIDAPTGWQYTLPTIDGPLIEQVVDASVLSESYTYLVSVLFDADVDTRWQLDSVLYIIPTFAVNTRGVTRKFIRQSVGTETGDMVLCVVTSGGSNVAFADRNKLWRPRDEYIGRVAYFVGGTVANLQEMRKIIAADSSSATVQWSIGLPQPTQADDEVELWSRQGTGWDPDEVNRLIRTAHEEANAHFPLPATAEIGTFSADDPYIAIPNTVVAVTGISWISPDLPYTGDWSPIARSSGRNSPGYYVEKETRRVVIAGDDRSRMNRMTARIHGYIKEQPLDSDTAVTNFNVEYLTARIKDLMWSQIAMKTDKPQIALNAAGMARQEAMIKRAMVVPRRSAHVDWVG